MAYTFMFYTGIGNVNNAYDDSDYYWVHDNPATVSIDIAETDGAIYVRIFREEDLENPVDEELFEYGYRTFYFDSYEPSERFYVQVEQYYGNTTDYYAYFDYQ